MPGINKTLCTGLPDPGYTFVGRPSLFGLSLASQQSFAWFSLGVLLLSVFMVRIWRDKGVARRLVAVRDNELDRGGHGDPDPAHQAAGLRALGLHGRLRGRVLRLRHPAAQQHRHHLRPHDLVRDHLHGGDRRPGLHSRAPSSAPSTSRACPRIFGANQTIQFITSGLGLIAFILYLPGGLAEVLHRSGDLVTMGIRAAQERLALAPGRRSPADRSDIAPSLVADGAEQ